MTTNEDKERMFVVITAHTYTPVSCIPTPLGGVGRDE